MSISAVLNTDIKTDSHSRRTAISDHPSIFTDIYQADVNIAIWQRELSSELKTSVSKLSKNKELDKTHVVTPTNVFSKLIESDHASREYETLYQDISELVEMFSLLYELDQVGLRLSTLDRTMCPRFHVDKVPCRLVCTYHGVASEWLPHHLIDRTKLGTGNNGMVDEKSGLFQSPEDIMRLNTGDVALLKGELWEGNANAGLVHRSPQVLPGEKRILLTLDFV